MFKQTVIGSRLNPQDKALKSSPWFEGWYTRVIGPEHSLGLVTGYFPDQAPTHAGCYTGLLFNKDLQQSKLQVYESYVPNASGLKISRGKAAEPNLAGASEATDFCFEDTKNGIVKISADPRGNLLVEGHVQGAKLQIRSLAGWEDTPWTEDGGSPQGLLHLLPGVGLNWYVHSTKTRVQYELHLPTDSTCTSSSTNNLLPFDAEGNGSASGGNNGKSSSTSNHGGGGSSSSSSSDVTVIKGEGWAHVEKNWGSSFPRSFIWAQGFSTAAGSSGSMNPQSQFCLAGGVLPTLNLDKLPVPLPNALLLGYRSPHRTWHFKPQSPSLFSTTVSPEQGSLTITARQVSNFIPRTLVLKITANPDTFSRVGGPTRGGFVPHSVESYSAKATAECYEWGRLVEVTSFDRSALEFGGSYACALEKAVGRDTEGLVCEPQWET